MPYLVCKTIGNKNFQNVQILQGWNIERNEHTHKTENS